MDFFLHTCGVAAGILTLAVKTMLLIQPWS